MDNLSQKNRLILAFIIGAVGILIGVFLGNSLVKRNEKQPSQVSSIPKEKKASLSFHPESQEVDVGDEFGLEIRLNAAGLVVSSLAARVVYEYEDDLPLSPQDVKMRVNPDLTEMDWVFPVNSIEIDERNKRVIGELAAVNLNPGGYPADSTIFFAAIDFKAEGSGSKDIVFRFDPEQTKLLSKDGKEITLELKESSYNVD